MSAKTTKTEASEAVAASTLVQLRDNADPSMINFMTKLLKSGEDAITKINQFTEGRAKLGDPITKLITSTQIPVVQTDDLDARIEANNAVIVEQTEAMNESAAKIDEQIAKLNLERQVACKPFEDAMQGSRDDNNKAAEEKAARVQPVVDAIQGIQNELEALCKKHEVPTDYLAAYVTINSPIAKVKTVSTPSTGTGRGRGGAVKVRITKDGATTEFTSLNKARSSVYAEVNGEEPKHGANAQSCTRYLENAGYTVEGV